MGKFLLATIAVSLFVAPVSAKTDFRLAKSDPGKLVVLLYLDLANDGRRAEAIAKYTAPGFVNHRETGRVPGTPPGPAGVPMKLEVKIGHIVRDGDLVMVHYLVTNGPGVGQPMKPMFGPAGNKVGDNVVDIFRLKNGRIIEKWDAIEAINNMAVFQ